MPWVGDKPDRPHYPEHFPEVVERLDEPDVGGDPARFLVHGDTDLTRARIRGIADQATIRAWIAVANSLRQRGRLDEDDYPEVLEHLQERRDDLDEEPDESNRRRPVHLDVVREKRDRDQESPASAAWKIQQMRTDGGSDDAECFRCGLSAPADDLVPFDLPDGETVQLHPGCRERWEGRTFVVGGAPA